MAKTKSLCMMKFYPAMLLPVLFSVSIILLFLASAQSPELSAASHQITINPYIPNPEFSYYKVTIDNGLKIYGYNWSATFQPYFYMNSGQTYAWSDIPPSIQKDLWKLQIDETHYKYGADFNNVPASIKNNLKYVILHRTDAENLTWDDVRLEGSCIIVKEKVSICHDDILANYTIPLINRTDIVIGNLTANWISNADGTFNISFDPTITITSEAVMTTSILTNVTAEAGNSDSMNFTHLNITPVAAASPAPTTLYNSLIGYWNFDGDKPNTPGFKAYDLSGNNRDGTAVNDTYVNSTNCVYGSCAKFDGNDTFGNRDYINLANKWTITGNYNITISVWVNPHNAQKSGSDARFLTSGTECVLRFITISDRAEFVLNSLALPDRVNSLANTVKPEMWTHIAAVYNGTSLILYINGTQNNQSAGTSGTYGECKSWEISASGTAGHFNGSIDELMFFNTTLNSSEILDIYNNQSARFMATGIESFDGVSIYQNGSFNRVNVSVGYQSIMGSSINVSLSQMNMSFNSTGMSIYMPFETNGADDLSNTNVTGTLLGGLVWNSTGGRNDTGGYTFDGTDDAINLNDIDVPNNFTLSAWARPKSNTTRYIIAKADSVPVDNYSFGLYFSDGKFALFVSSDGGTTNMDWASTINTYGLNKWHQITAIFNGTGFLLYVNGIADYGPSEGTPINSVYKSVIDTLIGASRFSASGVISVFNGSIDDVMIFNRTLSAGEILALYRNQSSKYDGVLYGEIPQVIAATNEFVISTETDFVFPKFTFYAGNSTNPFYSPILNGSITLTTWGVEEEEEAATISITNTNTATEVNVTQYEFFNVTLNVTCLTGTCGAVNVSLDPYGWDVPSAVFYRNKTIPSGCSESGPTGLYIRADGMRAYITGLGSDSVCELNITDAWNITSMAYYQKESVSAQEASCQDVFISPDGTRMYVLGNDGNDVSEYALTTAWDSSTSAFSHSFSVNSQEISPSGFFFKSDGTRMYVIGYGSDNVSEYALSTAWNTSSASFSRAFDISSEEDYSTDVFFSPDGKRMYVSGNEGDEVHQYNLTAAWDVSTAKYYSLYDATAEDTNPNGIFFMPDGTRMYIIGAGDLDVGEYSLDSLISKGGMVSTSTGATPFYTNSTNPLTTVSLNEGESGLVTFWVNATGQENGTYTFFAFANTTANLTISNQTSPWNVTILAQEAEEEEDTCSCPTSGNWNGNCADNCTITNCNMQGNNISISGAGRWVLTANVINFDILHIEGLNAANPCVVTCTSTGCFRG